MSKKMKIKKVLQRKTKKPLPKIVGISLLCILFLIVFIVGYNVYCVNKTRQNIQSWFKVTYGNDWTSEELKAWDKLICESVPEIEKHLGHPPFVISIKILKGEFPELSQTTPTFGGEFDPTKETQEMFLPSPINDPSICLHELVHQFYQGHYPRNLFFREGIPIYLQKIIGDKFGYNHNDDPKYPEYFYYLGDNYATANQPEIAPYATLNPEFNDSMSLLFPMFRIQYGIFGYYWKVLTKIDPDIIKKVTTEFWKSKERVISSIECIQIAEKVYPGFTKWYNEQRSLVPNSFPGYRLMVFAWPQAEDLAILHWETRNVPEGVLEQPFSMNNISVKVVQYARTLYQTTTDMKDGQVVIKDFIKEMKSRFKTPFYIRVETGGNPNIVNYLEIK